MTRNGSFNLGVTDGNGENPWSATILSYDGNGRDLVPRPTTLALPVPFTYDGPTALDPGARITMAVTAPAAPGTYYLVDDMTLKLRPQPRFFALATIKVEGDPVAEPPPVFTPTGHVPDLSAATPDLKRTFIFSNDTSGKTIGSPSTGRSSRMALSFRSRSGRSRSGCSSTPPPSITPSTSTRPTSPSSR
jgi:hypothetical protein